MTHEIKCLIQTFLYCILTFDTKLQNYEFLNTTEIMWWSMLLSFSFSCVQGLCCLVCILTLFISIKCIISSFIIKSDATEITQNSQMLLKYFLSSCELPFWHIVMDIGLFSKEKSSLGKLTWPSNQNHLWGCSTPLLEKFPRELLKNQSNYLVL